MKQNENNNGENEPLERAVAERLPTTRTLAEQKTFVQLARGLSKLPSERARAALEISAQLASVNWRLGVEFLRAAPDAASVLNAEALRLWSDMGKRLSVTDVERGAEFYAHGVREVEALAETVRVKLFEVCARQTRLSVQLAVESLRGARELAEAAREVADRDAWLEKVYATALEIAQRSAKHSADFLRATPSVARCLTRVEKNKSPRRNDDLPARSETGGNPPTVEDKNGLLSRQTVAHEAIEVAHLFAVHAGGVAADFWANVPPLFQSLSDDLRRQNLTATRPFIERGGAVGLAVFTAHGAALRFCPGAFDEWCNLVGEVAASGNSSLVALARAAQTVFETLARGAHESPSTEIIKRVLRVTHEVARHDAESAINCFRSARTALAKSSIENFERWAREGLRAIPSNAAPASGTQSTAKHSTRNQSSTATRSNQNANDATGIAGNVAARLINRASSVNADVDGTQAGQVEGKKDVSASRPPSPTSNAAQAAGASAEKTVTLAQQTQTRAQRSYFSLETRASHEALQQAGGGLHLPHVAHTLQLYVEALTGRAVEIAPLSAIPDEARIGDGRVLHLPAHVAEFETDDLNFKLYKTLAAHAAGQIEFGTRTIFKITQNPRFEAAYNAIAELYAEENVDALDAFSLAGYIEDLRNSERALSFDEERRLAIERQKRMPAEADYKTVLNLFPQAGLAGRIFSTLENARIDFRLREAYKGLRRDLDFVQARLAKNRPAIKSIAVTMIPFELLFQITLCGGARDDARDSYNQIVSELELIVAEYVRRERAEVADTLMATSRVYQLFQAVVPNASADDSTEAEALTDDTLESSSGDSDLQKASSKGRESEQSSAAPTNDARDLFNQWASITAGELETYDALEPSERWADESAPEQSLESGETAHFYDEWDRELNDYRLAWCRVIEKKVKKGDRNFVELARSRHKGLVSSLRYQFQLMRPEGMRRVHNELDGDDYSLEAVVDYVIDRRAAVKARVAVQPNERLYTKRLRRERDVAVAFLLDQSSSTARTIGRNPLQPYTHPGRRIIEIEKEGLVLMSEALESVGDAYAIYGFTSEGRRNVRFYTVKDFDERLTDEVERRIGGINFQHNTRLGAAIRHASAKLAAREARTHLLIILTDGRPYDHDYGDTVYAREDTRDALTAARIGGITPFCITIDRNGEQELKDLYGDVGYTIIDDVLSLPERMPMIYRRLTT